MRSTGSTSLSVLLCSKHRLRRMLGVRPCDDVHSGAIVECRKELHELLRDPHVPQKKSLGPLRGRVKGLADIKSKVVVLCLTPL